MRILVITLIELTAREINGLKTTYTNMSNGNEYQTAFVHRTFDTGWICSGLKQVTSLQVTCVLPPSSRTGSKQPSLEYSIS
jgi:hypothetical protein